MLQTELSTVGSGSSTNPGEEASNDIQHDSNCQVSFVKHQTEAFSYELLSDGLMTQVFPKIQEVQNKVTEVTKYQSVLIESLQKENEKVQECDMNQDIHNSLIDLRYYRAKLLRLKNEMSMLRDKTAKMKQRSKKLQLIKQKDELEQQELERSRLEQERNLIAKPASNPN